VPVFRCPRTPVTPGRELELHYVAHIEWVSGRTLRMRTKQHMSGTRNSDVQEFPSPWAAQVGLLPRHKTMFRVSDTIRKTETADGGVLLDVHHGQMFSLNVIGSKILDLLQQGYDESRIADEISRDYGMSKNVVRADVIEFIETLQKHHILQTVCSANVT